MKDDAPIIEVMIRYCDAITSDIGDIDRDGFMEDELIQRSCGFSLIQLGEYCKRVSEGTKTRYGDIEWRKIAVLRDLIVHAYEGINPVGLWDVVINDIPVLRRRLAEIHDCMRP